MSGTGCVLKRWRNGYGDGVKAANEIRIVPGDYPQNFSRPGASQVSLLRPGPSLTNVDGDLAKVGKLVSH